MCIRDRTGGRRHSVGAAPGVFVPAYRLSRRAWAATVILVLAGVLASLPASPARAQSFGDAVVAQAATHYGAPYRCGGRTTPSTSTPSAGTFLRFSWC